MTRELVRSMLMPALALLLLLTGTVQARWYSPETGGFISVAPYPPAVEHPYTFALQVPNKNIDPTGMTVEKHPVPDMGGGTAGGAAGFTSNCTPAPGATMPNGAPPPAEGAPCAGSCFAWRDSVRPIGPHGPPALTRGAVPPDFSLVDYHPILPENEVSPPVPGNCGQPSHVGIMIGGCVANCYGGTIRYFDPTISFIPMMTFPSIPVHIIAHPW